MQSHLNNNHQRIFGERLQKWLRIQLVLKHYEVGYVRKTACIFTPEQILLAMQLPQMTPEWILQKCVIALLYCGGLRCYELWTLKVGDMSDEDDRVWVSYTHAKQKAEEKRNTFLVPFNRDQPAACFTSRVREYLFLLKNTITDLQPGDALFHRPHKGGYSKAAVGKNFLAQTGKLVAAALGLTEPESYTGHCFRRTSATAAANAGANTMQMKRHFGWRQEGTALRYTEETRDRAKKMAKLLMDVEENEEKKSHGKSIPKTGENDTDDGKVYHVDLRGASNCTITFN